MRTDKQRVFDYLSWAPAKFAHWTSEDLKSINDEEKFHSTVDKYMDMLLSNTSNNLEIAAVVYHWLVVAKLPLDGNRSGYADKFHKICGPTVIANTGRELEKTLRKILK